MSKLNPLFAQWRQKPTRDNMDLVMAELYSVVSKWFRSEYPLSEDIAQEVCLRVWVGIQAGSYDEQGKFSSYCATVAGNCAATMFIERNKQMPFEDGMLEILSENNS
jgi:DNA-directed RNA polymerase specialized sigma24 family protein